MANNREVINEAYAAFSGGDLPALLALMSDDVDWEVTESLPQGGSFRGRDAAGEFFAGVAREWPELKIELDALVADGDHVIGVGRGEGKLASGEDADYGFAHVFTLGDGKIVRFREYVAPGPALL